MTKAQSGFVADSGIQQHSAGADFPITTHVVGGVPRDGNYNYHVVQHPCGVKRFCYFDGSLDLLIQSFKEADLILASASKELVKLGLPALNTYASEATNFELALQSVRQNGGYTGEANESGFRERLVATHEGLA